MEKYDVIIIGSGLSGLQCGYILSKEGYKVLILEQHKQIGGCLQNFQRNQCVFDTGIHYIGGLDEGQSLHKYFTYFGLMKNIEIQRLDNDNFDNIQFLNEKQAYPYAMGHENFVEQLSSIFPAERKALQQYVAKLKEICNHFPLYNIEYFDLELNELQMFAENANQYIKKLTSNPVLQNVLAGTNPLYAGKPEKTPLYVHALVNNSFIESSWRVVGGSSRIADVLAQQITANGGTILTSRQAEEFVFTNKQLTGVRMNSGEIYQANYFISSIHPANTVKMIDEIYLRKAYRDRILNLQNTTSNFTLYVVFHENSFPYYNRNEYFYKYQDVWRTPNTHDPDWPYNFLLITPASKKNQTYAECATVMAYMDIEDVRQWENTSIENRGNDYLDFKAQQTEKLLDFVNIAFPGFKKAVKKVYSSSPLTYRDYTGTVDGSLYGIIKDCNEPLQTLISPKTKIPNLWLTGQNIILHGVLGVTIGAVTTCSELLGLKYLVESINKSQ